MKKLLPILLCLPFIGFGQQTYVPDDNFEAYLEANGMGNGIANDDYVTTANINNVTFLSVHQQNIYDLAGIEDFTALTNLSCYGNYLTSLDLSNNNSITSFTAGFNQLTSLNLSGISCVLISENNITQTNIIRNNLTCIEVSDVNCWDSLNSWLIDTSFQFFSTACSSISLIEEQITNKELLKVTDLLGRETKGTKNEVLFYIYDDGTVEKRIVIE